MGGIRQQADVMVVGGRRLIKVEGVIPSRDRLKYHKTQDGIDEGQRCPFARP